MYANEEPNETNRQINANAHEFRNVHQSLQLLSDTNDSIVVFFPRSSFPLDWSA